MKPVERPEKLEQGMMSTDLGIPRVTLTTVFWKGRDELISVLGQPLGTRRGALVRLLGDDSYGIQVL